MSVPRRSLTAPALAAFVLGLLVCPLVYVAVGALFRYPAPITFTLLPFFVASEAILLVPYLPRPRDGARARLPALVAEGASWLFVLSFPFFVSGFGLMTDAERFGRACGYFLGSSTAMLPLGISAVGMLRYLAAPPELI